MRRVFRQNRQPTPLARSHKQTCAGNACASKLAGAHFITVSSIFYATLLLSHPFSPSSAGQHRSCSCQPSSLEGCCFGLPCVTTWSSRPRIKRMRAAVRSMRQTPRRFKGRQIRPWATPAEPRKSAWKAGISATKASVARKSRWPTPTGKLLSPGVDSPTLHLTLQRTARNSRLGWVAKTASSNSRLTRSLSLPHLDLDGAEAPTALTRGALPDLLDHACVFWRKRSWAEKTTSCVTRDRSEARSSVRRWLRESSENELGSSVRWWDLAWRRRQGWR